VKSVGHWVNTAHHSNFSGMPILGTAANYMDRFMMEATGIWLHPKNFNKDQGFTLKSCMAPSNRSTQSRDVPVGKQGQVELGM
jgi:hypothetical protein